MASFVPLLTRLMFLLLSLIHQSTSLFFQAHDKLGKVRTLFPLLLVYTWQFTWFTTSLASLRMVLPFFSLAAICLFSLQQIENRDLCTNPIRTENWYHVPNLRQNCTSAQRVLDLNTSVTVNKKLRPGFPPPRNCCQGHHSTFQGTRSDIFTLMLTEMQSSWSVTPSRIVVGDVLEERSAPIFRIMLSMLFLKTEALGSSAMSVTLPDDAA